MPRKCVTLVAITLFVASCPFAGCATSVVEADIAPDAAPPDDAPPSPLVDTGRDTAVVKDTGPVDTGPVDTGTAPACYRGADAVLTVAGTSVAAGQKVCTAAQINDFYTSCLPGTATACSAYRAIAANKGCLACITGGQQVDGGINPNLAVLLPITSDGSRVIIDIVACGYVAILQPACAVKEAKAEVCASSTCDTCTTAANLAACKAYALAGVCAGFSTPACTSAFAAGKATIDTFCRGTTIAEAYTKVATFICGT
jgi:hypothetical protein